MKLDRGKVVREIARERVGRVKASYAIKPATKRKPKHKVKHEEG